MLVALVDGHEFFRCSYLIMHEYEDQELRENPPQKTDWSKLRRKIKLDNPILRIQELPWEELAAKNTPFEREITTITNPEIKNFDMLAENK